MKKVTLACALATAAHLAAAQPAASPQASAAPPAQPSSTPAGAAASHLCGGIGTADQERMKSLASRYDMMLTFAASTGAYLADVDVEIRDARGATVLHARCEGPIMLVALPEGSRSWRIIARHKGEPREKTVTAGARPTFVWPAGSS